MAGVLMPVSSLPGGEGIGTFGTAAYEFVDMLAEAGVKVWQLLPLNPLSFGNSPYQPFSSYAGDELYIDLGLLERDGLLPGERPPCEGGNAAKTDFQRAREYKEPWLRKAFEAFRARPKSTDYQRFRRRSWVYPYAVFIALKRQNGLRCWVEWPKEQQDWILDGKYNLEPLKEEIEFQIFLQYTFLRQWMALKSYANRKGLLIMGDMPFYVGIDSLDVWANRDSFLLDEDGRPSFVAGVPPDYFSVTGQRWGNPIYNWEKLEADGFRFWIDRIRAAAELYDIVRVDHFRAFDTYWKIPASCPTAVEGAWLEAPGYKLLDAVYEALPELWLVAEDLGELRPQVLTLRDHYKLWGMYITEFSVMEKDPTENQVAYTGTHDNQTALGWFLDQTARNKLLVRRKLRDYLPGRRGFAEPPRESVSHQMIRYICESASPLAVAPLADILSMDDEARLNTPGTVGSPNWEWRVTGLAGFRRELPWLRTLIRRTGRA